MNISILKNKFFFFFILIIFGILISSIVGYGDDLDFTGLIFSFINVLENGVYTPSRFYGSPLAELIIGFFAYFFGGKISAFLNYVLFIFSLNFLFAYYYNDKNHSFSSTKKKFFILCITNPVLIFDGVNPSDFTLALFFFSLGLFLLKTRFKLFSSILFACSIACRANFAAFVIIILISEFFLNKNNKKLNDKILFLINTIIITCLFYLPVTIVNKFNFNYISNPAGPELEFLSLFPRFIYKFYLVFGVYNSILLLIIFILSLITLKKKNLKNFFINEHNLILIFITNTIIFFFIPTKTAIISLAIILFYILLVKNFNKKILFTIIFFNILYWLVSYQFLEIRYKNTEKCAPIEAIDAKLTFIIQKGFLLQKIDNLSNRKTCNSSTFNNLSESQKYLRGEKLFGFKSLLITK
jgi:hypothetical protein